MFPFGLSTLSRGATGDPSLIFGSLVRAVCNLADMGRSSAVVQKVLHADLEALLTSFPCIL